ncbi:MAG: adenylyltransferase/cytidyltransferase family protein [Alphaproteobacteria bacterium]|nr:adenylyltransferase/cytidyltransferase family protein [Alphaproteobacteria bacterium]
MGKISELHQRISEIPKAKILVIGDVILDQFIHGEVERISSEAPVPVLVAKRDSYMPGGAGNVMSNLAGLQAQGTLITVTGNDAHAQALEKLLAEKKGGKVVFIPSDERRTTLKVRYVGQSQQMLKVDFVDTHEIPKNIQDKVFEAFQRELPQAQVIILSDYGNGVLARDLTQRMIAEINKAGKTVLVDPRGEDFSKYKGATIITPNRSELRIATRMNVKTDDEVVAAMEKMLTSSGIESALMTRSQDGITVVKREGKGFAAAYHVKPEPVEVFDVSGAGDTVIATVATVLAAGGTLENAAEIANLAGGVVVTKVGTTPIYFAELQEAASRHGSVQTLIADEWPQAQEIIEKWRRQGLKVGLTNGCFDILHAGHVEYLAKAAQHCDRLILGLNTDASVRILKGPERPVNNQMARAQVMGALDSIDLVVFFGAEKAGDDNTASALIAALKPDVYLKGGDYTPETLPETPAVKAVGGAVEIISFKDGFSTTNTIEKIKAVS